MSDVAGRVGPLRLPMAAWRSQAGASALRARDVAGLLRLAQQYTGVSQARLAAATGLGQSRVNEIINRHRRISSLTVLERVADGLSMPDSARMLFGLAPALAGAAESIDDLETAGSIVARSYPTQSHAGRDIRDRVLVARSIDVLAVRGLGLLTLNDSLLRTRLTIPRAHRLALRVALLNPAGHAAARRADEIGESAEAFAAGIRLSERRVAELAQHPAVTVEAHRYDTVPTWRIIAVDDTVFVGTFDADWEGHASPLYRFEADTGAALYRGMRRTLDGVFEHAHRII